MDHTQQLLEVFFAGLLAGFFLLTIIIIGLSEHENKLRRKNMLYKDYELRRLGLYNPNGVFGKLGKRR